MKSFILKASLAGLGIILYAGAAHATMFTTNYGDFAATTVSYNQVTESSGTDANALYYAPTIAGDTLNFDPIFTAFASGAGGTDTTDGQLGFDINADPGNFINKLMFSERGDFSLSGFSNDAYADVSASFFVEILEVDGVALAQPINASTSMTFDPNANGSFLLSVGGVPLYDGIWSGDMAIDIEALLVLNGIPFINGATKLHMELDNTLTALSQAGTSAYIAKKDFQGFSVTAIPEPATLGLVAIFSAGFLFTRRVFPAV